MRYLTVDPLHPDSGILRTAADSLRRGAVVAYPTETSYGLAVDPRRDDAVQRVYAVKGRDAASAIALIAADPVQAAEVGRFGAEAWRLAARFWPGPLTIVVPAAAGLSRLLSGERSTVGVRVPAHPVARGLAAAFGFAVTATSANQAGRAPALSGEEVAAALGGRIDIVVDGGATPGGLPSTLVELVDGRPVMRRAGAIAWERVLESLE